MDAKQTLLEELRRHALILGEVTLTSGATAQYYVDAKRAILRPAGFLALGTLVAERAREWGATAVGGLEAGDAVARLRRGAAEVVEREQREARHDDEAQHDREDAQWAFEHASKVRAR